MNATDNGRLVKWLRQRRGEMTLERFSEITGVSKSTLQRYEAGLAQISVGSKLLFAKTLSDFPEWALPRDFSGNSVALSTGDGKNGNHRVEEERALYNVTPDMNEFERRIEAMKRAQSAVTAALVGYGLAPAQHITFHQLLSHLIVQRYITPEGVAESVQWYAFETKAEKEK